MSCSSVLARNSWKFVGCLCVSLCLGTKFRLIPWYDIVFTVLRILLCIAFHCSDLIVFFTMFILCFDSFFVSGLFSFSYYARRSWWLQYLSSCESFWHCFMCFSDLFRIIFMFSTVTWSPRNGIPKGWIVSCDLLLHSMVIMSLSNQVSLLWLLLGKVSSNGISGQRFLMLVTIATVSAGVIVAFLRVAWQAFPWSTSHFSISLLSFVADSVFLFACIFARRSVMLWSE